MVRIFKTDGVEVVALQGLDLVVDRGEPMALVCASGSGYVDQAIEDDPPLDVMVFMLRTGITMKTNHAPAAGQHLDSLG